MMKYSPVALVLAQLLAPAAHAQAQNDNEEAQHQHENTEVIVINASPLVRTELNSAQPISVISGDELREKQAHTLGETLANEPGINSTHFARVASSPIIRGLDGPRVKVTQNGLDSADVSRGSPDHAVTTETSVAQQVEILRGPATLLYGSGAIGGVVNVVDERIAQELVGGTRGFFGGNLATVDDLRDFNAGLSTDLGQMVFHIDGFSRRSDDYSVPSFVNDEGETVDTIENSFVDAQGGTLGLSYIFDAGYIGASYARLEQEYGIPGHHHHGEEEHEDEHEGEHEDEHAHEEEAGPFADLVQDRWQLHAGLENPWQGVEQLTLRYAYTDYQHQEIEGDSPSTTFTNDQHELRVTANHQLTDQWYGAFGYHGFLQEQSAFGEEAYTPASETDRHGLFWLLETRENKLNYQLGIRYENVQLDAANVELGQQSYDFDPLSASFGVTYQWRPQVMFNANYSFAQRAPSANEIFANGAHLATQTYELGLNYALHQEAEHVYAIEASERSIELETSHSFDVGAHFEGNGHHLNINLFANRVDNFIYENVVGINSLDLEFDHHEHDEHDEHGDEHVDEHDDHDHADGLPVVQYNQEDVLLFGYEIDGRWQFTPDLRLDAFSDYTRAYTLDSTSNLPRIPSQRIGADVTYNQGNWESSIGYTWYAKQTRVAENETSTPSYGLLNAQVNFFPQSLARYNVSLYLKAENITDKLGYVHTSFLKYDAPVAGRNFSLGFRGEF